MFAISLLLKFFSEKFIKIGVIWKKDKGGYTNLKGLFRKDEWGTAEKISVDNDGIWKLPAKYVKYFK